MLYISRWKTLFIWLTVALGVLVALPNAFTDEELEAFPSWFPTHKITLGLDLQGGSHIMLKLERGRGQDDAVERTLRGEGMRAGNIMVFAVRTCQQYC